MPKTARLMQVNVQPVYLIEEDGEIIGTHALAIVPISAKDWPSYELPSDLAQIVADGLNEPGPIPLPQ